jgi:DNA polymerase-3 subunit alpha
MPVTQFNMKWVEPAGLVKFDFGLKTLTVLDVAVNCSGSATSTSICRRCRSTMRRVKPDAGARRCGRRVPGGKPGHAALIDMRPDRFEDIIALVALYRPGLMANIPTYARAAATRAGIFHPILEPILKRRSASSSIRNR